MATAEKKQNFPVPPTKRSTSVRNLEQNLAKKTAKKPPLGSGARFAALKKKLAGRPGVTDPGALAAYIGRKKYGNAKFQAMSAKGRRK